MSIKEDLYRWREEKVICVDVGNPTVELTASSDQDSQKPRGTQPAREDDAI